MLMTMHNHKRYLKWSSSTVLTHYCRGGCFGQMVDSNNGLIGGIRIRELKLISYGLDIHRRYVHILMHKIE